MRELVLQDVKPLLVVVGELSVPEGVDLVEPGVVALGERFQGPCAHGAHAPQVVVEGLAAYALTGLVPEARAQAGAFAGGGWGGEVEAVAPVVLLDAGDVLQEHGDAVGLGVEQVVEFGLGEAFDGLEGGGARVGEHADEPADGWGEQAWVS